MSNNNVFKLGARIVPLDAERDPNVYTKADAITMDHMPSDVKPLPSPDKVELNGAGASE